MSLYNLTSKPEYNQVFYANGGIWQIWNKPVGAKFIHLFVLGGGAGGGRGQTANGGGVTRSGGVGGGSGAIAFGLFPANKVPDKLYIKVGQGSIGAAAFTGTGTATASGAAELSYVSVLPDTTSAVNLLLVSGAAAATGNTGSTIFVQTQALLSYGGIVEGVAGINGGAGGASSTPATYISFTNSIVTGGAGGSGISSVESAGAAAGINAYSNITPLIAPGTNGATTNPGLPGGSGYTTRQLITDVINREPMMFTGGAGGGCSSLNIGGAGGHATFGCGGGGSGAGGSGTSAGGNGGHGLVVITCS